MCSSSECYLSKERVSDTSGISDINEPDPETGRVSRRLSTIIESITGLSQRMKSRLSDAETTQVIEYTIRAIIYNYIKKKTDPNTNHYV